MQSLAVFQKVSEFQGFTLLLNNRNATLSISIVLFYPVPVSSHRSSRTSDIGWKKPLINRTEAVSAAETREEQFKELVWPQEGERQEDMWVRLVTIPGLLRPAGQWRLKIESELPGPGLRSRLHSRQKRTSFGLELPVLFPLWEPGDQRLAWCSPPAGSPEDQPWGVRTAVLGALLKDAKMCSQGVICIWQYWQWFSAAAKCK